MERAVHLSIDIINAYVEEPSLQFAATLWLSYPVSTHWTPYPYILRVPGIDPQTFMQFQTKLKKLQDFSNTNWI